MSIKSSQKANRHYLLVALVYFAVFIIFFSPAFIAGHPLAVGGDGLYIYLPNYYSRKVLWDRFIFSGFPMMADPQVMSWYPPAFVLSLIPHSWNVFMLLGYVAASLFMYGYVFTVTGSKLGAFISGLVYGLSGFMIAHLGHAVIIQSAAWIPLVLWSIEKLRRAPTIRWFTIGAGGTALSFLGGHSQIFFYGLILSLVYMITFGPGSRIGWRRFYIICGVMIVLAVGLCSIQFIPTAELARQSGRASFSFQDFTSFSLPPRQALILIFPNIFGNTSESGLLPYFGAENRTELAGYVGLLPLMLGAFAFMTRQSKLVPLFWITVAAIALMLAMGNGTPVARILYHVPILNGFRAPARYFLLSTIAISVLAGIGTAVVIQGKVTRKLLRQFVIGAIVAMFFFAFLLVLNSGYLRLLAAAEEVNLTIRPWANRAVATPLIIFTAALTVVIYWHRKPSSASRIVLLCFLSVIDLGSFGWFHDWRYFPSNAAALTPPEFAVRYASLLESAGQRLLPYRSARGTLAEMPPNLTRLWRVPSAGGYNVLVLSRISNLLPMIDHENTPLPWTTPENKAQDLLSIRYLSLPQDQLEADRQGVSWSKDQMQQWLGSGCGQTLRTSLKFNLPQTFKSTSLGIVSRLACSSDVPDQTRVAHVKLIDAGENVVSRELLAGRDSSEWAADCAQVRARLKHRLATIYSSYPAKMYDQPCSGHFYVTKLSLDGATDIKQIQIDWEAKAPASMIVEKMSLVNDQDHSSLAIDSASANENWRLTEQTAQTRVYENLEARPRVWLVPEIQKVSENEALQAVQTGHLRDGRSFDLSRIAVVEGVAESTSNASDSQATATLTDLRDTSMSVQTNSSQPAFLLTSDAYYPGWHATVDGQPVPVYRADYAIRGVLVSAGRHVVRFEYWPRSFYLGASVSIFSLLILSVLVGSIVVRSSRRTTQRPL